MPPCSWWCILKTSTFHHATLSSTPHKPLSLFWCWKMFVGPQMGKSSETDAGHPCLVYAAKCIFTPLAQKSKDQNQSLTKKVTSSFFQYNHLQLTYAVTMKLAMYSSVWGPLLVHPRCRTNMEPRWHPIARCPSHHDPASKDVPQSGHQGKPWSDPLEFTVFFFSPSLRTSKEQQPFI